MTLDIEQIKRDREAGTPGPWRVHDCESMGYRCTHYYQEVWNCETDILVAAEVTRAHNDGGAVNIRRIARVPELEAAAIRAAETERAADGLATDFEKIEVLIRKGVIRIRPSDMDEFIDWLRSVSGHIHAHFKAKEADQ